MSGNTSKIRIFTKCVHLVRVKNANQTVDGEILRLPKRLWTFTGFYYDKNTSLFQRILGTIVNIFIVFYLSIVTSFILLFLHFDDDVSTESILNVGYEFVTAIAAILTFFVFLMKRNKLIEMTRKVQDDVNRRVNSDIIQFYLNAEKSCNYATKLPIIYFLTIYDITVPLYILANWLYETLIGDVNVEGWFYIYVIW